MRPRRFKAQPGGAPDQADVIASTEKSYAARFLTCTPSLANGASSYGVIRAGVLERVVDVNDGSASVTPMELSHVGGGFDGFYRASFAGVLRVAIAVTGDRHVAAEVTQEAFIAARQRWGEISGYDMPEFWVRRVAINRGLSWRRRAAREARALVRLGSRRERSGGDEFVIDEVWRHVRRLPKRQAAVIALVYVDDLTVEQAANTLGIGVPTAKTHLQRARRTLAEALREEFE